jgi:2-dehydro-3-deoxyphosphogluconate aldolase/(4S)-4-hydroxy-2-oxoglutarate aldolase
MDNFLEEIKLRPLVVIYRGLNPGECLEITEVLAETGIRFFEVTMNTPDSLQAIKLLRERMGPEIHIGAGTVATSEQVKRVSSAGGTFIVSPNVNKEVITQTKQLGMYSIPGALTPTEIMKAWEIGADIVKVFPINVLGAEFIRQFRGPMQDIPLMATGGIRLDMVEDLFEAGADAMGISVHLFENELIENKDWDGLRIRAKQFLKATGYAKVDEAGVSFGLKSS